MRHMLRVGTMLSAIGVLALILLFSRTETGSASDSAPEQEFFASAPVSAGTSQLVSALPVAEGEAYLQREINPRHNPSQFEADMGQRGTWDRGKVPVDPLSAISQNLNANTPPLSLSFDGSDGCNGCSPPDVVGDVGPNHYVSMVNVHFSIYDKMGNLLTGPTPFNALFAGEGGRCESQNAGDPIPLYDPLADRWLLSQFASQRHMCIAISQTSDPTGAYNLYEFNVGSFPDYFKFGVWTDGYYMSANEGSYTAYAFDRVNMLAGNPATFQKFTGGDNLYLPSDVDGATPPSAGSPNIFYTFKDDNYHGVAADAVELREFSVDWVNPANTTFALTDTILMSPYTYTVCGFFDFDCVRQAGTNQRLDTISEWPMFRFPYRNFGSYEALAGTFTVGGGQGEEGGAVRWFELRNTGSGWTLYQEGTQDPADGLDRWNASISMDQQGNIALGYSVSSSAINPEIRYTTRLATDPLGTMGPEKTLIASGGSQTGSNRWGDYSAMSTDPADDCTFWYTNEYYQSSSGNNWSVRVGAFTIDECVASEDDFTIVPDEAAQTVCVGSDAMYSLDVNQIGNFTNPVTLSAIGNPGTASFAPNPVVPTGTSVLTISGAIVGMYSFNIEGMGGGITQSTPLSLDVLAAPAAPMLVSPADGATGAGTSEMLTWVSSTGETYTVEVATDAAFTNVVDSSSGIAGNSYTVMGLDSMTTYYWRVTANNECGDGTASEVYSFTTDEMSSEMICNAAPFDIPDGDPVGTTDDIVVGSGFAITDMNVTLDVSHTWVGDLIIALEHVDTGTIVTLLDQPGVPAGTFGCGDNDIQIGIADDEGNINPIETFCPGSTPWLNDSFVPEQALSAFDGEALTGTWRLSVSDNAGQDTGIVNQWCLEPTTEDPTDVSLTGIDDAPASTTMMVIALLAVPVVLLGAVLARRRDNTTP